MKCIGKLWGDKYWNSLLQTLGMTQQYWVQFQSKYYDYMDNNVKELS